ncbi:putative Acyltransferase 3 [metagenome]|uniref:Putative Acyltransferase 3 n=1 Tax=metagenome TaxID=256318 RepID=A0A2P2C1J7_9ZZZZ
MADLLPRHAAVGPTVPHGERKRKDIQALRALAVAMVVVYHFWPNALPGGFVGVDVFFVISGFLITGGLFRKPPSGLRDLTGFWARRVLRLMPAAAVTLLLSLLAVALFLPLGQWQASARHALSSMFYVENWRLISEATDYLQEGGNGSPFQHFWSLSVEEQYYITWPVLVCVLVAIGARRRWALRTTLGIGVGVVTAASLAYGLAITWSSPAVAYFSTPARMWELGLGGLLAILEGRREWPATATRLRTALAWCGVAMMLAAAFLLSEATPFPGVAALLPTVGAAAFILAADPDGRLSLRPLTHAGPVQLVGDTSYAMYLWHWPVLLLAPLCLGVEPSLWLKLLLLPTLLALSWASTTFVEDPIRTSRPGVSVRRRGLVVLVVASSLVVAASGAMWWQVERSNAASARAVAELSNGAVERSCLGAGALDDTLDCPADPELVTTPEFAKTDQSESIQIGVCLNWPPFGPLISCTRGETESPTAKIALYGNSHAGHWQPAVESVATARGWQLDTYVVGVCQPTLEPIRENGAAQTPERTAECQAIESEVLDDLTSKDYDTVVMSTMDHDNDASTYAGTLERLTEAGVRVVVIRDTPAPLDIENDTPFCLSFHLGDPEACAGSPEDWIRPDPLAEAAQDADEDLVTIVDLNDRLCAETTCPAVMGGVIVYSDYNHMSKTFNTTLAPYLEPYLVEVVGDDESHPIDE